MNAPVDTSDLFELKIPTRLVFGPGRMAQVGAEVARMGRHALLVTMPDLERLGLAGRVIESLQRAGIRVTVWTDVRENPRAEDADRAAERARTAGCDCVVALGGGSAMDQAKAVAVVAATGGPAWDYVYSVGRRSVTSTLPLLAVPTTSGTGSHMTGYAVLSDETAGIKSTIITPKVAPAVSVVDPDLMASLPPRLTAVTGFDVFAHCFEAYISRQASRATDMLAETAIPLVLEHLPRVVRDPQERAGRVAMAWADTLAGILIFNAGTTLPHAVAQPISGRFPRVRHGETLAIVYPAIMEFSWQSRPDKFARLSAWFRGQPAAPGTAEAARDSVACVTELLDRIGLRLTLADFRLTDADIAPLIQPSADCPDVAVHPVVATREDIVNIFRQSLGTTTGEHA